MAPQHGRLWRGQTKPAIKATRDRSPRAESLARSLMAAGFSRCAAELDDAKLSRVEKNGY
jgi:hypothetical protein